MLLVITDWRKITWYNAFTKITEYDRTNLGRKPGDFYRGMNRLIHGAILKEKLAREHLNADD